MVATSELGYTGLCLHKYNVFTFQNMICLDANVLSSSHYSHLSYTTLVTLHFCVVCLATSNSLPLKPPQSSSPKAIMGYHSLIYLVSEERS